MFVSLTGTSREEGEPGDRGTETSEALFQIPSNVTVPERMPCRKDAVPTHVREDRQTQTPAAGGGHRARLPRDSPRRALDFLQQNLDFGSMPINGGGQPVPLTAAPLSRSPDVQLASAPSPRSLCVCRAFTGLLVVSWEPVCHLQHCIWKNEIPIPNNQLRLSEAFK